MTIAPSTTSSTAGISRFSSDQLLRTAQLFAADADLADRLPPASDDPTARRWVELDSSPYLQIWLIAWPAGSSTGWHDHDRASGAFLVVDGALTEQTWVGRGPRDRVLTATQGRSFGPLHIHNVANRTAAPALSVHLYTPRLERMTRYAVSPTGLRVLGVDRGGADW